MFFFFFNLCSSTINVNERHSHFRLPYSSLQVYTSLRAIVLITGLDSFDKLAQLGAKIVYSTFKNHSRN